MIMTPWKEIYIAWRKQQIDYLKKNFLILKIP